MVTVLFVCLGNICRSPMAEAIFRQKVQQAGLESTIQVFSAATSRWEVGSQPHKEPEKFWNNKEFPIKECGQHKSSQVILKNMIISLGWMRIMWQI